MRTNHLSYAADTNRLLEGRYLIEKTNRRLDYISNLCLTVFSQNEKLRRSRMILCNANSKNAFEKTTNKGIY